MGLIPTPGGSKSQDKMSLNYIRPRHGEIARRLVLGQTQAQICRDLGMNQGRMSLIVNSPLFKIKIKQLEAERNASATDITQSIREFAPDAVETLARTMYAGKSERLRFNAAQDLLDRAGHGAVQKSMVAHTTVDTNQMQDHELRNMIKQRLNTIMDEDTAKADQAAEAERIELTYDHVDEDSPSDGHHSSQINLIGI